MLVFLFVSGASARLLRRIRLLIFHGLCRVFFDFYVETGGCGQVTHGRFPTTRSSAHFQLHLILLILEEGLGLASYG